MTAPAPAWSIAGVEYHVGDCRELLPALIPRADAIATDPPYGIGGHWRGTWRMGERASDYDSYPVAAIPGDETTPVLPSALLNFPRSAVFSAVRGPALMDGRAGWPSLLAHKETP